MKKNLVKAILKAMATAAMAATIFVGTGKEAKAAPSNHEVVVMDGSTTYSDHEMLDLVNADRAANGAGALTWNAELEAYCYSRLAVALANYRSPEYAAAEAAGLPTNAIAHRGATVSENLVYWACPFYAETSMANECWILSVGHHNNRINAGWTQ